MVACTSRPLCWGEGDRGCCFRRASHRLSPAPARLDTTLAGIRSARAAAVDSSRRSRIDRRAELLASAIQVRCTAISVSPTEVVTLGRSVSVASVSGDPLSNGSSTFAIEVKSLLPLEAWPNSCPSELPMPWLCEDGAKALLEPVVDGC